MADRIAVMARGVFRVVVEENGEPGKVVLHLSHPAQRDACDFEQKVHIMEACGWTVIGRAERVSEGDDGRCTDDKENGC